MNSNPKTKYLDILQIFRGIAALMVVLHHSIKSIQYYHEINYPFLNYIGSIGKFGVDFFFVLSGFIITYSASIKYDEPNSFQSYVKNRLIRIYVPYLPIGIFMLVVYQLLPGFSNGSRDISILTSLTLIPAGNPALSVAWTLSFELLFYLLFSISFVSKKLWNGFVLVWFISIIIFTYSPLSTLQSFKIPIFSTLFSPYNLEFILGYCLALCVIRKLKLPLIVGILALIVMMSSFFYCNLYKLNFFKFDLNLLFALGIFIIIYIAIDNYNFKIKSNRILMLIGNATYSIYLVHNPLQMIVIRMYPKISSITSLFIAIAIILILSSVVGYVYYLIFEKKIMIMIKSKLVH